MVESVLVMYVATRLTSGTVNYQKTLTKFEFASRALAMGEKWGGWRFRMKTYMEACQKLEPSTIVVLTDADDVLAVRPSIGILELYHSFGRPIVLATEPVCLRSNCQPVSEYWKTNQLPVHSTSQFVNCGSMMGTATALATMWAWMLNNGYEDDQFALGNYTNHFPELVALDSLNRIFYIMPPPLRRSPPSVVWDKQGTLQKLTDNIDRRDCTPYFLHFAGNFVEPAIGATFQLARPAPLYDIFASQILSHEALPYFNTSEDGRKASVIIVWAIFSLLMFFIIVLSLVLVRKHRFLQNANMARKNTTHSG